MGASWHSIYVIDTYVKNYIEHDPTNTENQIYYVSIQVEGIIINNIYKPPNVLWPPDVLSTAVHPSIYAGDFNRHHGQ